MKNEKQHQDKQRLFVSECVCACVCVCVWMMMHEGLHIYQDFSLIVVDQKDYEFAVVFET